jgi:PAS domain S-box-containing protein
MSSGEMPPAEPDGPGSPRSECDGRLAEAEQLAQIGTWEWNPDTRELVWSDNMFRLLGFEPAEFVPTPQHLWDRMHPAEAERVRSELQQAWNGERSGHFECRIVRPDGTVRHVRSSALSAQPDDGADGADGRLVGFLADVTEQVAVERELSVQRAVSKAFAQWESFAPGAERLLRELTSAVGVAAAALWLPQGDVLRARVLWSAPGVERQVFDRFITEHRLPRGVGLAGQAWESRAPTTPARSGADDGFLRRQAAAMDGISSAVAFPAIADGEVLAVVVLYSREPVEQPERLTRVLASVGEQLGRFLARRPGMLTTPLTPRELEVLTLAAQGLTGPEIAERLLLSAATIKTHLENLYAKMGVSSRVAAVAYALREGLID